jgi:N-acetylneuraminic acid mutarotase
MQSATILKNYMIIHGGRNDEIYKAVTNSALNDLHIYDIFKNSWINIAMYGEIPTSRWGHSVVADETQNLVYILGGSSLYSFCDTSIYQLDFSKLSFKT